MNSPIDPIACLLATEGLHYHRVWWLRLLAVGNVRPFAARLQEVCVGIRFEQWPTCKMAFQGFPLK